MRVSCRHWSVKIGAVFFYSRKEDKDGENKETHKAKMLKKRAEICERYDKKIRQAEAEKKIMLCVFDYGLPINNVIYYPHTNTLSFNWNGYGEKNHTGRV